MGLVLTAALAAGVVLVLSSAHQRRSGTNGVYPAGKFASVSTGGAFCQPRELVPQGTATMRLALSSGGPGPGLLVTLRQRKQVLDRVRIPPGWTGKSVDVPVATAPHDIPGVVVCVRVVDEGTVGLIGWETPPHARPATVNGERTERSVRIDYLRPGRASWWGYAATVAKRLDAGHDDWHGAWILAALAIVASWAIAARLVLTTIVRHREEDATVVASVAPSGPLSSVRAGVRRIPATARAVLLVGFLNAVAWSLITPVFQVPDEITHVAYVQQIAETGRPPVARLRTVLSPELATIADDLHNALDIPEYHVGPSWTRYEQRRLRHDLRASLRRRGNDDAGASDPEPPLYYALEAAIYKTASSATLLDRIALMRLLSAVLAGLTALFALLFLRECLPAQPWAWTVGGLGASFVPMFGYVSGGVNPDALLYATCAALLYLLARAFRRGLTPRLAAAIGSAIAVGLIAKLNFYGLLPGALVAVALAARKSEASWNGRVMRLLGLALAIGLAPFLIVTALDALAWDRSAILAHSVSHAHSSHRGLGEQLSYMWQVYLPPLPGQHDVIPGPYPGYDAWFKSFIGAFGPLEVLFPLVVYRVMLAVSVVIAGFAARALYVGRAGLRARRAELAGYLSMVAGLLLLIALVALRGWAPTLGAAAQGRYLLPLLALFAAVLALAARGAGARWGRAAGVAIVVGAVAWSVFGQLLVLGYFYG